jgi:CheY-like chemotaxis protein
MKKINTVLLVDDDQVTNLLNSKVIKKVKLASKVDIVLNGKEALEYLENVRNEDIPHIIFLDINMPYMNGFEFLDIYNKKFNEKHGTLVLMMLTTSINSVEVEKARSYGSVSEFISKPLTVDKLKQIMEKYNLVAEEN